MFVFKWCFVLWHISPDIVYSDWCDLFCFDALHNTLCPAIVWSAVVPFPVVLLGLLCCVQPGVILFVLLFFVCCFSLSLCLNLVCFTGLFFDVVCCNVWVYSAVLCAVLYYAVGWCFCCKVWFCMLDYLWSAVCHDLLVNGVGRCRLMFYIVRCLVMCCSVLSCRAISCSAMSLVVERWLFQIFTVSYVVVLYSVWCGVVWCHAAISVTPTRAGGGWLFCRVK